MFSTQVGLWAAGLCQLLPGLYQFRLNFLLDFPLTVFVALSFWCLTVWRGKHQIAAHKVAKPWWWAIAFGITLGVALLVKQTALFFLFVPIFWVAGETLVKRKWQQLLQLITALLVSLAVCGAWYRFNWLFVLTTGKRATIDSAIAENDPALNTVAAWTYYWQILPAQVSWLLLLVPIVGLLLYGAKRSRKRQQRQSSEHHTLTQTNLETASNKDPLPLSSRWVWLAVFWIGSYLLSSLNINKDSRYVLPYLPVVALFLPTIAL